MKQVPLVKVTRRSQAIALLLVLSIHTQVAAETASKAACNAANESAISFAQQGKLIEQQSQLLLCSDEQCPPKVVTLCLQLLGEVTQAIPTIIFHVQNDSGQEITDVSVTMDGRPFASELTGNALRLNPGKHEFTFEAEGHDRKTAEFDIEEGRKDRVEVINMTRSSSPPPAMSPGEPATSSSENFGARTGLRGQQLESTLQPQFLTPQRVPSGEAGINPVGEKGHLTRTLIAGAVAAIGFGIGTALLVSANHTYSAAHCDSNSVCDTEADVRARNSAIHRANWAGLPFGVGVISLLYSF